MVKLVRIVGRLGGGSGHQVAYLHHALRSSFETVLVIGAIESDEQDMTCLLKDRTGVITLNTMSRSVSPWRDLVSFFSILRVLIAEKPDIVHTHAAKAGVLGRLAAFIAGVPVRVHTYHGNVFQGYFGRFATSLIICIEKVLNRLTTRVIAISNLQAEDLAQRFRVAPRSKVAVIRTGFDLKPLCGSEPLRAEARRLLNVADHEILVVWAGRLVPIKNLPLLFAVVRRAAYLPQVKFVIVGDGPNRVEVISAAKSSPNLQFLRWQNDMTSVWAAADVALLTSKNEGTPATLIEAMAAGKPFISTAVGGVPDLAKPPVEQLSYACSQAANGFLTASDPEAIVACIEKLVCSPKLAKEMGEQGRAFVLANHDQARLSGELTELYERLLKDSRTSRRARTSAVLSKGNANN